MAAASAEHDPINVPTPASLPRMNSCDDGRVVLRPGGHFHWHADAQPRFGHGRDCVSTFYMMGTIRSYALCLLAAGCSRGQTSGEPGMDGEMRSVCVGTYTLEMPVGWTRTQRPLGSGGDATFYFGHDEDFVKIDAIVLETETRGAFDAAVLRRESRLREQENFASDGTMFVSRETVGDGVELIQAYASVDTTDAIRMEVHRALRTTHVVLAQTAYSAGSRDAVRGRLLAAMASVQEAAASPASASSFCVGNVLFDLASDYQEAEVTYAGRAREASVSLRIDINTFAEAADEPSLIPRGEANLAGLGVRPQKLRAGTRPLAGDAGEEWLGAFVEDGRRVQSFYAETTTRTPTSSHPKLMVNVSIGEGGAMDDAAAVAVWDQILGTLRKR